MIDPIEDETESGGFTEANAARRRDEALKQMLQTLPQPRGKKGREPKPARKSPD